MVSCSANAAMMPAVPPRMVMDRLHYLASYQHSSIVWALYHQDTLGKYSLLTWVIEQSCSIIDATMHLYQGKLKLQGFHTEQADKTPTQF